jgi:hypothetical protein
MWVVPGLYVGGPEHIYWYFHGINPRTWFGHIVTVVPSLRKLPYLTIVLTPLIQTKAGPFESLKVGHFAFLSKVEDVLGNFRRAVGDGEVWGVDLLLIHIY